MASKKGRELIISVEDSPGSATYTQVAGLRAKQFIHADPSTVVTDEQSPGRFEERETGYAVKSVRFSGNGRYTSHATQRKMFNALWNASAPLNYKIAVPGLGVFIGPFTNDSLDLSGNHDGELGFSAQFDSAGEIAYTPAS